ncbi:PcfJ domain-containing protein [Paenibacillus sp. DCT19]|uniref:PcfJ domain-containing protein n=1 Tax=Paenibacillus sp. DCT19 TaxID=2211212 RepID=UPI0013E30EAF
MHDEGIKLEHCVGRYAEGYGDGRKILMCIRKSDSPDVPFYTLELIGGRSCNVEGSKIAV